MIKQRLPKLYRHPDLDKKLNESRVKSVFVYSIKVSQDHRKAVQKGSEGTSIVQNGLEYIQDRNVMD